MPTPKTYVAKDGTTTYRVRFRHNGTNGSETFLTQRRAEWFCQQITEHGSRFALRALADLEEELADQGDDDSPTLNEAAELFFAWKDNQLTGELTSRQERRKYDHHIGPTLGDMPVNTISTADVERWLDLLKTGKIANRRTKKPTPLGPTTIRKLHSLLSELMAWCCDPQRGYATTNPCKQHAALPRKKRPVPRGMMPMQWQTLHAAFLALGYQDAADLGTFLIGSGWRISEAAALPAENVEDYGEGRPMWVTMNQVMRRGEHGSRIALAEGKSASAMRRIQLDPETASVVRRNCQGKKPGDLVFLWKGEHPWQTHNFRDRLEKACDHANLPHITAHWFRHTHVAWLAMAGAPLPELQRRIGHANITTTIGTYGSMIGDVGIDTLTAFTAMRDSTPAVTESAPTETIESHTV